MEILRQYTARQLPSISLAVRKALEYKFPNNERRGGVLFPEDLNEAFFKERLCMADHINIVVGGGFMGQTDGKKHIDFAVEDFIATRTERTNSCITVDSIAHGYAPANLIFEPNDGLTELIVHSLENALLQTNERS